MHTSTHDWRGPANGGDLLESLHYIVRNAQQAHAMAHVSVQIGVAPVGAMRNYHRYCCQGKMLTYLLTSLTLQGPKRSLDLLSMMTGPLSLYHFPEVMGPVRGTGWEHPGIVLRERCQIAAHTWNR